MDNKQLIVRKMKAGEEKDVLKVGRKAFEIIEALFLSKAKDAVVAILDDCLVNLPGHLLEEVEGILKDEEDIESIKAGMVHFTIRTYESHGKTCYSPNWVDAE